MVVMNPADKGSKDTKCPYCSKQFQQPAARWSHQRFCKVGPAFTGQPAPEPSDNAPAEPEVQEKEWPEGRIPSGSRIMYGDPKYGTHGHTGVVLSGCPGGVRIEPMAPKGEPATVKRVQYEHIRGYWPKGSQKRTVENLRRDF